MDVGKPCRCLFRCTWNNGALHDLAIGYVVFLTIQLYVKRDMITSWDEYI